MLNTLLPPTAMTLAIFSLAPPSPGASLPCQQDGRSALSPQDAQGVRALGIRPSLLEALDLVHQFDRDCLELGLYKPNGVLDTNPLTREADENHPLVRFLELGEAPGTQSSEPQAEPSRAAAKSTPAYPGVRGFHFPAVPPSLEEFLECNRYHLGYLGARAALGLDPGIQPLDVLKVLSRECLMATPVEGSFAARELHQQSLLQQRFAVLGNGSFCYLAWGFLQQDGFWERAGKGSKAAFVQAVLELALQSDTSTWMCQRVLYPPLMPTDEQPGRGVARPFDPNRGVIGFTKGHELFVEGVRSEVSRTSAELASGAGEGSPSELLRASAPRLRAWSGVMLDRILRERAPAQVADGALRDGSLEDRLQYWRTLRRTVPFEVFNAAYVDELKRMASGADGFEGAARVEELEALAAERGLSEGEQADLTRLKGLLQQNRVTLIAKLGGLLVASGGPMHVAAVAATLAGPTEEILTASGGLVPGGPSRSAILGSAWVQLGLMQSDQCLWVVEDHLSGTMELPEYALDSMMGLLPVHRPSGFEVVLGDALRSESASMQSRAIMNPNWMDQKRFKNEFQRLVSASDEDGLSRAQRNELRFGLVNSLLHRSDGAGRELLLQTFEQGYWKSSSAGWSSGLTKGPWMKGLWAKLKPSERQGLIERGLAPTGLFD